LIHKKPTSLLLEEIIKLLANIIALNALSATARGERDAIIRLKIIAEVGLPFVPHVFRLYLGALIVLTRVEKSTILAAVHIRAAVRTFIRSRYFTYQFYLTSTIVTDHNYSSYW
jgi:hypothetical protein